ncbi:MAG TPA: TadE family protein [Bryobacteraceae bacterium]|nr:TadE family protein [Bryobacteraceae bacterium]
MRGRRGTVLIEFAASLILLSGMFTGIFQIGYTFFTYTSLVNAVRAGARYASLQAPNSNVADPEFAKSVANMVVYGDPRPAPSAKPVVRGLTPDNVDLKLSAATATVSVRAFSIDALFTKVSLAGRPTVTFPFTAGGSK